MPTRRQTASEDTLFWTLKLLQDNPGMTEKAESERANATIGKSVD